MKLTKRTIIFEKIADDKETNIKSSVLKEFIDVYNQVGKSVVAQLPVELALVKLIQKSRLVL